MSKPNYSMMILAAALVVMFSVANCNLSSFVRRARFSPERPPLTCSKRSPRRGDPILSGATVTGTCLGITNTTNTDAGGNFILDIYFSNPTQVNSIRRNCIFSITLPANCTVPGTTILVNDDRPEFRSIDNSFPGGSAIFQIEDFEKP